MPNSSRILLSTSSLPAEPGNTLKEVHYSVVVVCMVTKNKNRLECVLGLTQIIGINVANGEKWKLWDLCHSALELNLENGKELFFQILFAASWDVEPRDPKGLELSARSYDCVISLVLKFTSKKRFLARVVFNYKSP